MYGNNYVPFPPWSRSHSLRFFMINRARIFSSATFFSAYSLGHEKPKNDISFEKLWLCIKLLVTIFNYFAIFER
jgi:hypothetical protein